MFQAKNVGEPIDLAALRTALAARGAVLDDTGRGTWKPLRGEVTFSPVMENGQHIGLDVRVPFQDTTDLIDLVAKAMLEIAETLQLRVMDPLRSDSVSLAGLSALQDEYLRNARYAGEYGGVSEALGLSSYAQVQDDSSSYRWLAALAVFALALYGGWKTVVLMKARAAQAEEDAHAADVRPITPTPTKQ